MEKRELAFAASRAWFACAAMVAFGVLGCGNSSPTTKEDGGTGGATAAKGGAAGAIAGTGGAAGSIVRTGGAAGATVATGGAAGTTTPTGGAAVGRAEQPSPLVVSPLVVQPEARTPRRSRRNRRPGRGC